MKLNFKTYVYNNRQYNAWIYCVHCKHWNRFLVFASQLKQVKLDKSDSIKQIASIVSSIKMGTTTVHSIKKSGEDIMWFLLVFHSDIFDCEFFNIGFYDDGNLILRFFLFVYACDVSVSVWVVSFCAFVYFCH